MKKIEEYYAPWVKGIPMYISDHIEKAWTNANASLAARFGEGG